MAEIKPDKEFLNYLHNAVKVCSKLNADQMFIDDKTFFAQVKNEGILVIQNNTIKLPSGLDTLHIERIDDCLKRMNMFESSLDKTKILAGENPRKANEMAARALIFDNGKTTMELGCSITMAKVKRNVKDPVMWNFSIDSESSEIIKKSATALKLNKDKNLNVRTKDGEIIFQMVDQSGDKMKHLLETDVSYQDDTQEFDCNYKIKIIKDIFPLHFKDNDSLDISITRRGLLNFKIFDFNVYVIPEQGQ